MTADSIHALCIVGIAAFAGSCVNKRDYGWATTFALLDIAMMFYK